MTNQNPDYLGDGVYVGHDGYQIWLKANSHEMPSDSIALEPEVLEKLIQYANKIYGWNYENKKAEFPRL